MEPICTFHERRHPRFQRQCFVFAVVFVLVLRFLPTFIKIGATEKQPRLALTAATERPELLWLP